MSVGGKEGCSISRGIMLCHVVEAAGGLESSWAGDDDAMFGDTDFQKELEPIRQIVDWIFTV